MVLSITRLSVLCTVKYAQQGLVGVTELGMLSDVPELGELSEVFEFGEVLSVFEGVEASFGLLPDVLLSITIKLDLLLFNSSSGDRGTVIQ